MDAPVALGDTPLTFARGLGGEFDFYGVQPIIALNDAIHLSPRAGAPHFFSHSALGVAPKSSHTRRPLHRQDLVAPPTKMDESELINEGHYAAFGTAGARTELPGCSLCMGIVNKDGAAIYKYLNFNQIDEYVENAKSVTA
jgi:hypothetical protein